jgi:hypothetical protein
VQVPLFSLRLKLALQLVRYTSSDWQPPALPGSCQFAQSGRAALLLQIEKPAGRRVNALAREGLRTHENDFLERGGE